MTPPSLAHNHRFATPRKHPKRSLRARLTSLAAGLLVGFVVFVVVFRLVFGIATPEPAWTSASGTPPDDRFFRILMFPTTGSATLFNSPDGVQAPQLLQRAVANTATEVESAGWISVSDPAGPRWVRWADLSFLPPPGQEQPLLDALSKSLQARSGDAWLRVSLSRTLITGGERLTAKIHGDDYHHDSTYTVINGKATPEQLVIERPLTVAASAIPATLVGVIVSTPCAVLAAREVRRHQRRAARPRRTDPQPTS